MVMVIIVVQAVVNGNGHSAKEGGMIFIIDGQLVAVAKGQPFLMQLSYHLTMAIDGKVHTKKIPFEGEVTILAGDIESWPEEGKLLFDDGSQVVTAVNMILWQKLKQLLLDKIELLPGGIVKVDFCTESKNFALYRKHGLTSFVHDMIFIPYGENLLLNVKSHHGRYHIFLLFFVYKKF